MRAKPIVTSRAGPHTPISAEGHTLVVHEWTGSGPPYLHVHHGDDEAWHVLEGTVRFRFEDGEVDAAAGTTVFVPAGVPHTFVAKDGTKYLIILTRNLHELISELHRKPYEQRYEVMRRYNSEVLE